MALTGRNVTFPIYNPDGSKFQDLELKKATFDSVVMSLGDKITGDVYYKDNTLAVSMREYIEYEGVKYVLVNPPTIVREGLVSDNSGMNGMTKYSFTFYHPMYMLGNFPFTDVAVSVDQKRYLSESRTFAWIGYLGDFVDKLNKNLEGTEWVVSVGSSVTAEERTTLSEVLSFDKNTIAEALQKGYETWGVPYVVDVILNDNPLYAQGKRFLVQYGLPSTDIYVSDTNNNSVPFVFHFGQGVGLKNNSRTPRNNKIVTRIAGYGSEDNIPYGYPQIRWYGSESATSTPDGHPIYDGIVGGAYVKLIKHPFTRTHLMPSVYSKAVFNKVSPYLSNGSSNPDYNPDIELVDYYDADSTYDNPIKPNEPSLDIHEFEKIKPEFEDHSITAAFPYDEEVNDPAYTKKTEFLGTVLNRATATEIKAERAQMLALYNSTNNDTAYSNTGSDGDYEWKCETRTKYSSGGGKYAVVEYKSSNYNFHAIVELVAPTSQANWNDAMDFDGNYLQSYFKVTLPVLDFDLYACAAITQEMKINMRSGACIGCTFEVQVDWDDYKSNFYDEDGNFDPEIGKGHPRDAEKYPDSSDSAITIILKKEIETFGTLMPNIYQQPASGDKFVILGISLPQSYVTSAEERLDAEMKKYMRENNVYYYDYPLKFDEYFLATHLNVLRQMKNNVIVRFDYAGEVHALYIKQMTVKYGEKPLPQYDITLTDDVEVVLNKIGEVASEVSNLRVLIGGGGNGAGSQVYNDNRYLRKDSDDTAYGLIRLIRGLQVGEQFVTGLLGEGGIFRKDSDGTTYLECDKMYVRMKAYFDSVEIRSYIHSGGNRVASKAGIACSRVEYIDADGEVTSNVAEASVFRCYFKATDNDKTITNDFVVGDLAFCRETNVDVGSLDMHGYWRTVVGRNSNDGLTEAGEAWIDLANTQTVTIDGMNYAGYQSGSDIPIAQDNIVQLGNVNDTTRQGAIIELVGGDDAPSYQIYQGINTFSLNGKNYIRFGYSSQTGRAYMNVYGDMFIGDQNENSYLRYNAATKRMEIKAEVSIQSTFGGQSLQQFIESHNWTQEQIENLITGETDPLFDDIQASLEAIQKQVDGSIETWYYTGEPTLLNLPAVNWTTDDDKDNHIGDLYYDKTTGYAYRFMYDDENHTYLWYHITDQGITEALANAAHAQDTADGKRRVFVRQPLDSEAYDVGDLWVNATYPSGNTTTDNESHLYYNDILRCVQSKAANSAFNINHWMLSSKYTDDSSLNAFKLNSYVQQLIGGTISQSITDAYQEAQNASTAASNAQNTASNAATNAAAANTRLNNWADDNYISPTEKTALSNEKTDVQKEYQQIVADATRYGVSTVAFDAAYNDAMSAFNKYTSTAVENIKIESDYANIAYYYTARQTILNAIAAAAKQNADNAMAKANDAYNLANTTSGNLTAYQEAMLYLRQALGQDTEIAGGLVLSTLIGLRDENDTIWAGINGAYDERSEADGGAKGHGIAAWYGGGMVDHEAHPNDSGYAKSLFRFDGSGYLASANISWDENGQITIKNITTLSDSNNKNILNELATFNSAFTFSTSGQGNTTVLSITPQVPFTTLYIGASKIDDNLAATHKWVNDNYVSIAFFNRLFQAFNGDKAVLPNDPTTTIDNIKAMFGLWTEQYISALGLNPSSSGGSASALSDLLDVELSSPSANQILKYNGTRWVNSAAPTTYVLPAATSSALGGIMIGYSSSGKNYAVQLDGNSRAYVNVPWENTTYTLPTASSTQMGGVKVGSTLAISSEVLNLASGIVTTGTYRSVTVDTYGRVTSGTNPTTLSGYGITDAKISNGVITLGSNTITPITSHQSLTNYVTLDSAQTISGLKTMTHGLEVIGSIRSTSQLISSVATGTAPLSVSSTTLVSNLNADLLDGKHARDFVYNIECADFSPSEYAYNYFGMSTKTGIDTNWWHVISLQWARGELYNDGQSNIVTWGTQLALPTGPRRQLRYRTAASSNSWDSWVTVIDSESVKNLFTSFTTSSINISATIGGTTLTVQPPTISYLGNHSETASSSSNPTSVGAGAYYSGAQKGLFLTGTYQDDATPAGFGNILTFSGVGLGQLLAEWCGRYATGHLYYRSHRDILSSGAWSPWKTVAFTDDNVASATKLQTARTIWGQSFDGTKNIEGTLQLNRSASASYGRISFYSSAYFTWFHYMTPAGTNSPTSQDAPSGNFVTSWALRSLIENNTGFGWTWESCSNASTSTPTIKMELSSSNGNLYVAGNICSGGNVGIGTTTPSNKLTVNGTTGLNDTLYIKGRNDEWCEGIRIQNAENDWSTIILGASGASGTNANAWSFHTNRGYFYLNRNGSNGHTGYEICNVGGNWGISTVSPSYKLHVNGTFCASDNSLFNGRLSVNTSSVNTSYMLYVNGAFGISGAINFTTNIGKIAQSSEYLTIESGWDIKLVANDYIYMDGAVGIFTASPQYTLDVRGSIYASTGILSAGYVTALSDIRKKEVVSNLELTNEEVALAPSIKFLWKEKKEEGVRAGSIAQYWERVLPEAVCETKDGMLSMDYGVIALLSAIATARKVEEHDRKIAELEHENETLRTEIEQLRLKVA